MIRNRIKDYRIVDPAEVRANPKKETELPVRQVHHVARGVSYAELGARS